jgi:Ca2+-binding RTX toxin-like protein
VTGAEAGTAYELAYTGLFAWENGLSSNFAQLKTINIGLDDGQNGQVYVYIGDKQTTGTAVDKAGLNTGNLYGIKVTGLTDGTIGGVVNGDESDAAAASGRFSLYNHGDVSAVTGADLDADSEANLVTSFMRPEDGHWDPTNANVFWFVTTAGFSGQSRLYKLTFDDITNPETGGTIEAVLDSNQLPINGTVGPRMMDNMTVNADGKIIIQEDPGNQSHLAKMFEYDPVTDTLTIIGESNPDLFITGAPGFLTQDEEHSGVIDVTSLLGYAGGSAYLLDVQSHSNLVDPELVQDGQFLAMYVDDVITTGTGAAETLNGSAAAETFNGKAGADIINAGSGDDTLFGANGDDTLNGGAGNDVLTGHAGDDVINGGAGSDTLRGAIGNDVLNGGLGKDLLVGGTGADTFVFGVDDSLVTARDRIQGFDSAEGDLIDLTALGVTFADLDVLTMASDLYAVAVDLDGNTGYEFVLMVQSNAALTSADFVL